MHFTYKVMFKAKMVDDYFRSDSKCIVGMGMDTLDSILKQNPYMASVYDAVSIRKKCYSDTVHLFFVILGNQLCSAPHPELAIENE